MLKNILGVLASFAVSGAVCGAQAQLQASSAATVTEVRRAEAPPEAGEPRNLPEVREELLDFALEIVDVALAAGHVSPVPTLGYGEKRGTSRADRAGSTADPSADVDLRELDVHGVRH